MSTLTGLEDALEGIRLLERDLDNARQGELQDFQSLKDAVWEYLDRRESPAPEIRDRALEDIQAVYAQATRND